MITEGWMNMKGGRFTADMSEIGHHQKDTGKDVHCPGCKTKLKLSDFKERKDADGDVTTWTKKCDCGADMTIFNEELFPVKQTFKQFLEGRGDDEMVGDDSHPYSVKITHKGKDKKWPALKGDIYEKDVVIGTFSRGAVRDGHIPPILSKFGSSAAKARFEDFSDSLSIAETIEALMP